MNFPYEVYDGPARCNLCKGKDREIESSRRAGDWVLQSYNKELKRRIEAENLLTSIGRDALRLSGLKGLHLSIRNSIKYYFSAVAEKENRGDR